MTEETKTANADQPEIAVSGEEESKDAAGEKPEEEKKKQSVFDEDIGGIEINIIGEDGQVRQGKQFEHNRHLPRGTRRPGIRTDRKIYDDDQIEKGEIFMDKQEPFEMTLGD